METKFLSDGRKVVVVGQINSTEYIVQEVFVTSQGDEIPSGERFTTKGLHDEPIQSYQDRQLEKQKAQLAKLQSEIKNTEFEMRKTKERLQSLSDQMKSANRLDGKLDSFDWDLFCDIATGNIKYIVNSDYYWYKPNCVDTSDYHFDTNGSRYDGLRMISLVFHGERDHSYNIFNYRDGSGNYSKIDVMRTTEELQEWLTARAEKEHEDGRLQLHQLIDLEKYIDVSKWRDELSVSALEDVEGNYKKAIEQADKQRKQRLMQLGLTDAS